MKNIIQCLIKQLYLKLFLILPKILLMSFYRQGTERESKLETIYNSNIGYNIITKLYLKRRLPLSINKYNRYNVYTKY